MAKDYISARIQYASRSESRAKGSTLNAQGGTLPRQHSVIAIWMSLLARTRALANAIYGLQSAQHQPTIGNGNRGPEFIIEFVLMEQFEFRTCLNHMSCTSMI